MGIVLARTGKVRAWPKQMTDEPIIVVDLHYAIRVPSKAVAEMLVRWHVLLQLWGMYCCG